MKILYIALWASMYGANISLLNLMIDIKNRYDIKPSVLINKECLFADKCRENGIKVYIAPYYSWLKEGKSYKNKVKGLVKIILNKIYRRRIFNMLKQESFDLVHTNSTITEVGCDISQYFHVPHIWHLREYGIDDYNLYYIYSDNTVKEKYNRTDIIIAISKSIYECYTSERKLCDKNKTRIIYNGINIPTVYDKSVYINHKKINFCILGVIADTKNQIMAIKACQILLKKTDNFVLNIIGDGEEVYINECKSFIDKNHLNAYIKFWGYRTDVSEILKKMDVGLMLSKREAFGRVTIEFMLHYMPVIGVNSGGTSELIVEDRVGYLCNVDDYEQLAQYMNKFVENRELIFAMGEYARKYAAENFSMEKNTDKIYNLYKELLKK